MPTAIVLWGCGSMGAAQVGMLRVLTSHGVRPDVVVGASVGALNGAFYAARPDPDGVEDLAELWLAVAGHDVCPFTVAAASRALAAELPLHPFRGVFHALDALNYLFPYNPLTFFRAAIGRRAYLFDNDALSRFLGRALPIRNLQDTKIPITVLTADADTGQSVAFSSGPALPALLASAAIPALYPSVRVEDRMLIDGGVADHTALDHAVAIGCDQVYLLAPGLNGNLVAPTSNAVAAAMHAYYLLSQQRMNTSIRQNRHRTRLHLLPPVSPAELLPVDLNHTAELINQATEQTASWLDDHRTDAARSH